MSAPPPTLPRPRKPGKRDAVARRAWRSAEALEDLKGAPLDAFQRAVEAVGAVPGFRADLEFVRFVHATPSCAPPDAGAAVEDLYRELTAWGRRHGLPVEAGTQMPHCTAEALDHLENLAPCGPKTPPLMQVLRKVCGPETPLLVQVLPPMRDRDLPRLEDRGKALALGFRKREAILMSLQAKDASREAEDAHTSAERAKAGRAHAVPAGVAAAWRDRADELRAAGLSVYAITRRIAVESGSDPRLAWPGHVVTVSTVRDNIARRVRAVLDTASIAALDAEAAALRAHAQRLRDGAAAAILGAKRAEAGAKGGRGHAVSPELVEQWRRKARAAWKRRRGLSVNAVARSIDPARVNTIRERIRDLKPTS